MCTRHFKELLFIKRKYICVYVCRHQTISMALFEIKICIIQTILYKYTYAYINTLVMMICDKYTSACI